MRRKLIAAVIGNIFEHYDNALFGLLAPFLAPLFFHSQDPFTALFLTYAMIPMGMIARPFGSLCFGLIADRIGRRQALFWSLSGMAATTIALGFLPTSKEVGALAPILLGLLRLIQSFFAAGETTGGAVFVLEHTDIQKRSFMSSVIDASSIGGILLASGIITLFSSQGTMEAIWRYLFWTGGITGVIGIFLRMSEKEPQEFVPSENFSLFHALYSNKRAFLSIILASGFSYTTYALSFILMNGYIPLVTSLTKGDLMKANTMLLGLDLFLLPFFGFIANRFGKEKIMLIGAISSIVCAIPLFSLIGPSSTLLSVTLIRLFIVLSGVAFAAPYHAWALEQVPPHCRSTLLCVGYTLGSQIIGTPTMVISLMTYHYTGWIGAPSLYLMLVASGALFSLHLAKRSLMETKAL
jgi:MFS family permease